MITPNVEEYMKLRQYFVNMVAHAKEEEPIPSERVLAEMFGVTRKTVRRALEEMVASHYLHKRPRRGYFANPQRVRGLEKKTKIVGMLYYGGRQAYYSGEDLIMLENLFQTAQKHPVSLQFLQMSNQERIYSDILNSGLDGLIWLNPRDEEIEIFNRLAQTNFPLVGLFQHDRTPEAGNYIYLNHFESGYCKTRYLIQCGAKRIAEILLPPNELEYPGYCRALEDAGMKPDPELLIKKENMEQNLRSLMEKRAFDGIICQRESADMIRNIATEYGIRIPDEMQIVTGWDNYDWNPTMAIKPAKLILEQLFKQLWNVMNGKQTVLQNKELSWNILPGTSTKNTRGE